MSSYSHRLLALALAGAMTFTLASCSSQESTTNLPATTEETDSIAVQTQALVLNSMSTANKVSGKVVAEDETAVVVPTSALCTAVYVEQGDTIYAGQPICKLDLSSTIASQNAANLNYQSTIQSYHDQSALFDAQIALAQNNLETTQRLFEIGAASQIEIDNAQLQLNQLQATKTSTLAQLEAGIQSGVSNLAQLNTLLEHVDGAGNVIAPTSGTISTLTASERNFISAAQPVAVITGVERLELSVSVSETLVPQLHVGDEVEVNISAANSTFTSKIRTISSTANAQTKLYDVTISIPSEVSGLMVGMFADVTFHTNVSHDTITVPSEAIQNDGEQEYVYVVENNQAVRLTVETGLTGNGITEVTSGLTEGQELVTVGQSYLTDGCAVRVVSGGEN